MEGFVSYCSLRNLTSRTVKAYIDGVKFFGTTLDNTPWIPGRAVVKRMLAGLHKLGKQPDPRKLRVTSDDIRNMVEELRVMHQEDVLSDYEVRLWTALFSVAWFGAFRVSEFLVSWDDMKKLCPDRVAMRDDGLCEFLLKKTKNNTSGHDQEVLFGPLDQDPICPVEALRRFLKQRPVTSGTHPLFVSARGVPIRPRVFNSMLRLVLSRLGKINVKLYSAKSFRVGAASEAFSKGASDRDLQALGRWDSEAFMYYIRSGVRAERAMEVQKHLTGRSAGSRSRRHH